jgi:hypothetical protein
MDSLAEVRPLARQVALGLIRQELAALQVGLNGSGPAEGMALGPGPAPQEATNGARGTPDLPETSTRRCGLCGQVLPASAFDPGRRQCRRCRGRQQAERGRRRREAAAEGGGERGLARA